MEKNLNPDTCRRLLPQSISVFQSAGADPSPLQQALDKLEKANVKSTPSKPVVGKYYQCAENVENESINASNKACQKYYNDRFIVFYKDYTGYYTPDNGANMITFTWDAIIGDNDTPAYELVVGDKTMEFEIQNDLYLNGYGSASTSIPEIFIERK